MHFDKKNGPQGPMTRGLGLAALTAAAFIGTAWPALAQDAAPKLDSGNTAWVLTSTALVLMMTIPGLALFYGGMVRKKNVLAMTMQCFAICCLCSVLWMVAGYSLAFTEGTAWIGGTSKMFLKGIGTAELTGTIPEALFVVFQMTFAVITPALIVGAFADRMKFSAMLWFIGLWSLVVYAPVTHWVWGGGFLGSAGVLDFAGGTVVHINAGVAGLVAAIMVLKNARVAPSLAASDEPALKPNQPTHSSAAPMKVIGRLCGCIASRP